MRKFLVLPFLALFSLLPASAAEIAAVRVHADWCGACQQLAPKYESVQIDMAETEDLTFIDFDYTKKDKTTFWEQADATGMSVPLEGFMGKGFFGRKIVTGFVILIDESTGEIVDTITANNSEAEIKQMIQSALDS